MARPRKYPVPQEEAPINPVQFNPKELDHPYLKDWVPSEGDGWFRYINEVVVADFQRVTGYKSDPLDTFKINKKHYKERMDDVTFHINYFIKFYDAEKQFFVSTCSVKYLIDRFPAMSQVAFKKLIIDRIITPEFVTNMKRMANDLYSVNINTDMEGKYKSTPKITNDHAKVILAISFAYRAILPLCVHYSNTNSTIITSKSYITCFDKIFMAVLQKFEGIPGSKNYIAIYKPICKFVKYRLDRAHTADAMIWDKKKQLYGITYETVFQNMIHEVILVKSLYKISYDRSVVSYIDGVVTNSYNHFRFENFKFKPVEIEADTGGGDSDDYLTHAESIEMQMYRIDESTSMINDVNNAKVVDMIQQRFKVDITPEEFKFYFDNLNINNVTQMLLHAFYSGYFHNSQAIYTISKEDSIRLLVIMKKYLEATGMTILPQICTAKVQGKFKENMIKNSKFTEKFETSDVYQKIIREKFRYIQELSPKEDPIVKRLSTIINSTFILVDPNPELNEMIVDDIPVDKIIDEFLTFLSIIR